ncbi:unnamed protein product [Nippostrongylus brasiliensis]|uniref:Uncharacterized protein n=1 Tax=Nippostrongylus brasiliensis TaxID=27835 RepID=A0A0N4Y179_NIPBR|nr:unnamed protein product [Nippostrongylus brasiliensis]
MCLEGSDCEKEASCDECSGVACTRITSYNLEDNREVALTCIPYDTRTFGRAHLEEAGCRRVDDRQICNVFKHFYTRQQKRKPVKDYKLQLKTLKNKNRIVSLHLRHTA